MADTTHNLKIRATLDATGVQQELDRLNQMDRAGQQGGQGSASGAARVLTKLDQTLSRLNQTLQAFAQRAGTGRAQGAVMALSPAGRAQAAPERIFGGVPASAWRDLYRSDANEGRLLRAALAPRWAQGRLGGLYDSWARWSFPPEDFVRAAREPAPSFSSVLRRSPLARGGAAYLAGSWL